MKPGTVVGLITLLGITALIPARAMALDIGGVSFGPTLQVAGADLPLQGVGLRTKLIVKVYAAGLYMEGKPADAKNVISADKPKALVMKFLYKEVKSGQLQEAWQEGFTGNTPSPSPELKAKMDAFLGYFSDSALKGDEYLIAYAPGAGTTVTLKGKEMGTLHGEDFMRAVYSIWFGEKPADKGLKKAILGGMDR